MVKKIVFALICMCLISALAVAEPSKPELTKPLVSTATEPDTLSSRPIVLTGEQLDAITSGRTSSKFVAVLPVIVGAKMNEKNTNGLVGEDRTTILNKASYEQILVNVNNVVNVDSWGRFTNILELATPAHFGIHGQTTGGITTLKEQDMSSLPAANVIGNSADTINSNVIELSAIDAFVIIGFSTEQVDRQTFLTIGTLLDAIQSVPILQP